MDKKNMKDNAHHGSIVDERILEALQSGPKIVDTCARMSGTSASHARIRLSILEARGLVLRWRRPRGVTGCGTSRDFFFLADGLRGAQCAKG